MPKYHSLLMLLAATAVAPVAAHATALMVNGTCEVGNCASVDSVSYGQSVAAPFSFNYTINSDTYLISGNSSASYDANGTLFNVFMAVTYTGSTPTTTNDVLKIDALQNTFDNSPGTWDGTYTETVPVTLSGKVGAGSTLTANLFYDGQGVGLVGPFGVGSNTGMASANLVGLTGDYLKADYQFTYDFLAGTQSGAGAILATSAVPEPSQGSLLGLAGGGLVLVAWARRARKLGPGRVG